MSHSHAPSAAIRMRVNRRGSVLLMVVAVLALLAIIAVSYTTLGRADRAASAALVREARLDDQASAVGDYLAGIIADDVLSTYVEYVPGATAAGTNWVLRRDAVDYPYTDSLATSDSRELSNGFYRFDPRGGISTGWTGPDLDPRRPSDPWLASPMPEWMLLPGTTLPDTANDPFSINEASKHGSWRNISIFAPDGRFVNLGMLRSTHRGGGFNVTPWLMTESLSVNDQNGVPGMVNPFIQGAPASVLYHVPADFGTWQYLAYRPMYDGLLPGDLNHVNNQWADTDGDGFADARWFELVDAFDRDNPRWILPQNGRARMFIAARAFDLTGLVNINTASDFHYEPIPRQVGGEWVHYPVGMTPADIDLRRLLSLNDVYFNYGQGYDLRTGVGAADYSGMDAATARLAGRHAYAAIRHALNTGEVLASTARGEDGDPILAIDSSESSRNMMNPNPLLEHERVRLYEEFGSDPFGATNRQAGGTFLFRAPFGLEDELELRAFNGVNDSDHFSKLERVADARYDSDGRYGPFRSNRPRSAEMEGRPNTASGAVDAQTSLADLADIRRLITTVNGARPIIESTLDIDPRRLGQHELKVDALELLSKLDPPGNTAPATFDIEVLFNTYINALMPYTDQDRYPDAWNRNNMSSRGLAYGESAEFALRAATHMLVNTIDSFDSEEPVGGGPDDFVPTRVALAFRGDAPNDPQFESNRVLSLRDNFAPASTGQLGGSPRLNIYGIEPQPFLIEVGWTGMFTDAPYDAMHTGAGADNDYDDNNTDPTPENPVEELGHITINFSPVSDNKDFLFEVLAFQLNNPFDHDIRLSSGTNASYYIEYANRYFALVETNEDGSGHSGQDIILPAYGTRVFYVLNIKNPLNILQRMRSVLYTPVGGTPSTIAADYITRWAQQQFGADAVRIPMVHRSTLKTVDVSGGVGVPEFVDLFAEDTIPVGQSGEPQQEMIGGPNTSDRQRKVAHLWRVYRPANANDATSDIMLDRIRDPSPSASSPNGVIWDARAQDNADVEIQDTEAGNDTDDVVNNDEDNTGFSFTKWAAFRRPTGEEYKRGSMPAWAVEPKLDNDFPGPHTLQNDTESVADPGMGPDFAAGGDLRRQRLDDLLQAQISGSIVNNSIQLRAEAKTGNSAGQNRSGKDFYDAAVQIHISPRGKSQLFSRAGDFLLPLAIGPNYDPLKDVSHPNLNPNVSVDQMESRWMTLSEALALACDYYTPPADDRNISGNVLNPLYQVGHSDPANNIRPRLDRGHLVLNDFVPYMDVDSDGAFDPAVDQRVGRGLPMAYNVVDLLKTASRWKVNGAGNLVPRTRAYGDLATRIPGQININTAPPSVLRLIPMFAPDPDPIDTNASDPDTVWVRRTPDPLYDPAGTTFDFASMVAAYRDKTILYTRPDNNGDRRLLDFRDENGGPSGGGEDGRFWATRIAGIREQPGFRSAAEILALRYHDLTQSNPARGGYFENSVDRFADDNMGFVFRQSKLGLESTLLEPDTAAGQTGLQADDLENDYDEQLTIANAALNSITVRSDVFCVYFLIHGYLPSDVENLGDFDPLVPSIARRYVMVVDRSNVTELGQKPRILMFQELPIR